LNLTAPTYGQPTSSPGDGQFVRRPVAQSGRKLSLAASLARAIGGFFVGLALYIVIGGGLAFLSMFKQKKRARALAGPYKILVMGRVDSANWCRSHLVPLSLAQNVSELLLVLGGKVWSGSKTRQFSVPKWLAWIKPAAIARSLWAIQVAAREKPDIVMAYSFFPPGFFALFAARAAGAASVVQLAGGPIEIESGGLVTDDPLYPEFLRKRLARFCRSLTSHFDGIVARGSKAERYACELSPSNCTVVIPGSVDPARYPGHQPERTIDIVFIGRVVPFKQPDHICQIVKRVAQIRPALRVVIAGNGSALPEMRRQAQEMGIRKSMIFAGHVHKVEKLLPRARIFLLTSKSEGLSIALAEAMLAGVVPVVPDVGDLSELVRNDATGRLVKPGDFDEYAANICELLDNESKWREFSANARRAALANNAVEAVANRWQEYLSRVMGNN
jgi:glycosyltransferase involved in cell wall biosynthesis